MSITKVFFRIFGGVVLTGVLMGCSTPEPLPTQEPTMNIQQTLNAVKTEAVETVIADLTWNAPDSTNTPVPVATNICQPTLKPTLKPTFSPTNTLLPWWTKTPAQLSGGCEITEFSPKMNEIFSANDNFDGKWVIKNTGDSKWLANEIDIRYATGTKFQDSVDVVDLKNNVSEEDTYTVVVDMRAPAAAGTYATTWVVYKGGNVICSVPLTIIVQ